MKKRGQAATEYILVIAIVFLIFVPATYIFMKNIGEKQCELGDSQLYKAGHQIVNTAEEVFYQGEPAKVTMYSDFPDGITNITIVHNWSQQPPVNELIFTYYCQGSRSEQPFKSSVNIEGNFSNRSMSQGRKTIVLTANRSPTNVPFVWVFIK